ncbi:hypothetical protein ACH95_13545 [Bacillus glycinifermentans]|nr:hypothetical protein ACH95_13545 [Bacillus glycinifermentans]
MTRFRACFVENCAFPRNTLFLIVFRQGVGTNQFFSLLLFAFAVKLMYPGKSKIHRFLQTNLSRSFLEHELK